MALIWSVYTIGMMVFYKESSISKGSDEENESLVSENKNDYGSTTQNSCEDNFTETNENVQSLSSIFAGLSKHFTNFLSKIYKLKVINYLFNIKHIST